MVKSHVLLLKMSTLFVIVLHFQKLDKTEHFGFATQVDS